jgi:hypothetical protein
VDFQKELLGNGRARNPWERIGYVGHRTGCSTETSREQQRAIPCWRPCISAPPPQAGRAVSYILASLKSRQLDIVALLLQVRCRYAVAFEKSHLDLPHLQVEQRNRVQNGIGCAFQYRKQRRVRARTSHYLFSFCLSAPKSDSLLPLPYEMSTVLFYPPRFKEQRAGPK